MAMVRVFGPAVQRAQVIGGLVAVAIAGLWVFAGGLGATELPAQLAVAALAGLAGAITAYLVVPRSIRRAFEAFSWLGRTEVDLFEQRTGASVPVGPVEMAAWLAKHPATPGVLLPRIEILAFAGRFEEARRELAMVEPDPSTAFESASLTQYLGWLETGEPGVAELRAAAVSTPPGTHARRFAEVTVALGEARQLAVRGDPGWTAPLEAVRGELGRAALAVVIRDTWSKAALAFAFVALIVVFGASLLRLVL